MADTCLAQNPNFYMNHIFDGQNACRNSTSDSEQRFPKHGAYIKCRLVFGIVAHFITKKNTG